MIGRSIGPYQVLAKLGAGGMGEVYRARDTKLNRDVAIKVLPDAFALDAERLARFTREAQLLASLNHPNIAAIYGIEEQGSTRALVMELVEGEDLSQRISRGAIPLDEALPIARQIAEALEAAHEQGIVHRDLKPANIKVRDDGTVKVLDFGLAKALDPAAASASTDHAPTITSPAMTMRGVVLGTPAYMSPEQAKGRPVDRRADIWAFGAVLFEMLAGTRAFEGDDVSEVMAGILKLEPHWTRLPADLPEPVRRLLRRCLEKDPKKRLRDVAEGMLQLEDALAAATLPAAAAPAGPAIVASAPLWRQALPLAIGIAVAALAAGGAWTLKPAPPPSTAVTRFAFTLTGQSINNAARRLIAISPDGSQIAYVANNRLHVKAMDQLSSREIAGASGRIVELAFSPDGRAIAFFESEEGDIKRIPADGGTAVTIGQVGEPFGMSWDTDYSLLIGQGGKGIVRVPAIGGVPETIVTVNAEAGELAQGPRLLPGGKAVMFTLAKQAPVMGDVWDRAQIVAQSLSSGERTVLVDGGHDAMYLPTGHLVFTRSGNLMAVPFDLQRLVVSGTPGPVVEDVASAPASGTSQFGVANNGSLAYIPGSALPLQRLTWFDRTGKALDIAGDEGHFAGLDLSPDGQRIAVHRHEASGGDAWVYDGPRRMRLTFEASQENASPIWSPDATRVVFQSLRNGKWGLYLKHADGSGTEELLTESDLLKWPSAWTPDGRSILYVVVDPTTQHDVWLLPLTGDRRPMPLLDGPARQYFPQVSPDGRWLAYTSNEGGTMQVFVQPFPTGSGRWLVSGSGIADFPRWRGDGKELFYLTNSISAGAVTSVAVNGSGASFVAGAATALFTPPGQYGGGFGHSGNFFVYAASRDGQRFLMPQPAGGRESAPAINVILNWTSLLPK
jgi:eukaryotic-like serine/threonine-protein kinase